MILHTNDYLEYYLTLVAWIINSGVWNMIEDSGLFAAPFAAIIISEWLKARAEGADEGNKGVLSLARVENRFYTAILVIIVCCMPLVTVSIDTLQFDRKRMANTPTELQHLGRWCPRIFKRTRSPLSPGFSCANEALTR
ncbi:conjugal transfer protein TraG N-terminal domain-containing protein, partial [Pseudomonas amygdali]|uniref:conjugal transfer protein TraG N-terminal domain-containing protein n=1 Tax=Pseudomonas amygdali TaxID=47877 RepID=UPI001FB802AD